MYVAHWAWSCQDKKDNRNILKDEKYHIYKPKFGKQLLWWITIHLLVLINAYKQNHDHW